MSIVQYLVVRADLLTKMAWPLGAVVAQACHASPAAVHIGVKADDEETLKYLQDLDNMRKVVLEAQDEADLRTLAAKLEENDVKFKLWVEQPENYPTCLASKPYEKVKVQKFFKKFKLYKGPELK